LEVPILQTGLRPEWTGMTPYQNLEQDHARGGMSHLLESGMEQQESGVESGIAEIKNTPVSMSLYESVVNNYPYAPYRARKPSSSIVNVLGIAIEPI